MGKGHLSFLESRSDKISPVFYPGYLSFALNYYNPHISVARTAGENVSLLFFYLGFIFLFFFLSFFLFFFLTPRRLIAVTCCGVFIRRIFHIFISAVLAASGQLKNIAKINVKAAKEIQRLRDSLVLFFRAYVGVFVTNRCSLSFT